MNFLKNKVLLREILRQGDLMHTIHGGIRETSFIVENAGDLFIRVSNPSISPEAFNFTIHNNNLVISAVFTSTPREGEKILHYPIFSRVVKIPFFVDATKIEATYKNGTFTILLPKNEAISSEPKTLNVKFLD